MSRWINISSPLDRTETSCRNRWYALACGEGGKRQQSIYSVPPESSSQVSVRRPVLHLKGGRTLSILSVFGFHRNPSKMLEPSPSATQMNSYASEYRHYIVFHRLHIARCSCSRTLTLSIPIPLRSGFAPYFSSGAA